MGTSYSYPASHLRGNAQEPRLGGSAIQGTSTRAFTQDVSEELRSVEELAFENENQRQFTEAAELRERALAICEEALGPVHQMTFGALQNLSIVYEHQGEHQKAERLYDRVFSDPRIGQSMQAIQHFEKVFTVRSDSLGGEHPSTLSMMSRLSSSYKKIGKRIEAVKLDEKVYETRRHVLGDAAPATLQAAEQFAESYTHIGQLEEAAALEEMIVTARKRSLGAKHNETQRALENLAATYNNMNKPREAVQVQGLLVRTRTESLGDQHPRTFQAQYKLAQYYRALGKGQEAAELEGKARVFLDGAIERLDLGPNTSMNPLQSTADVEMDQTRQMIKVFSPTKDWFPVLASIEASMSKSWISSRVVELLHLPVQSFEPPQYSSFGGSNLESRIIAPDVVWCGYASQRVRRTEFHVVSDAPFDLLLGSDFLFAEAIMTASTQPQLLMADDARDSFQS